MCDCARFNGCTGESCDELSPVIIVWSTFVFGLACIIGLPNMIVASKVLWTLKKKEKLNTGAASVCTVCVIMGNFFALGYLLDNQFRKSLTCDVNGGTPEWSSQFLGGFASFFALCYILSIINLALMWIDVHVKSKTMQKASASNSLLESYKKFLRGFSVFFGVAGIASYSVSTSYFILLTFLVGIAILIVWCVALALRCLLRRAYCRVVFVDVVEYRHAFSSGQIGAMNLSNLLTGSSDSRKGCAGFVYFVRKSILVAVCRGSHPDRATTGDTESSAARFQMTRFRMADMVEKAFVRVWIAVFIYMISCVVYVIELAKEVDGVPGGFNGVQFASAALFISTMFGFHEIFRFTKFMLRDVIGERKTTSRLEAGMSVNSSTTATTSTEDGIPKSQTKVVPIDA